ncbi:helix-turn-helix domain-containing protein [Paeniroseomonas aquatica]|uniref:helix-turn-helix domain-containing protein n=1 Tax=Paeniroseomonas aquatica TaxID=373043 RepID=UPI0036186027
METHAWPGNARELRNRVDRAVALADGPWIGAADLFPDRREAAATGDAAATLAEILVAAERRAVASALEATGWDVGAAAARLGVGRSTLFEKVRRLGLVRPADSKGSSFRDWLSHRGLDCGTEAYAAVHLTSALPRPVACYLAVLRLTIAGRASLARTLHLPSQSREGQSCQVATRLQKRDAAFSWAEGRSQRPVRPP